MTMRRLRLLLCLPGLIAAGPAAPDPVHALAGRYSTHFRNGIIGGEGYWSDNVAEIVPLDARHAYVNFELQFYNGHSCSLSGVAKTQGGSLVYQAPPEDNHYGLPPCRLAIRRVANVLAWSDGDGTCKAHCGARGSFLTDGLPWASRRPIRYMARLQGSNEFRTALSQWRR